MFSKQEKPLPKAVLTPNGNKEAAITPDSQPGIKIGDRTIWNPEQLPNGHLVAIGASGSGKTQTLKAIATK